MRNYTKAITAIQLLFHVFSFILCFKISFEFVLHYLDYKALAAAITTLSLIVIECCVYFFTDISVKGIKGNEQVDSFSLAVIIALAISFTGASGYITTIGSASTAIAHHKEQPLLELTTPQIEFLEGQISSNQKAFDELSSKISGRKNGWSHAEEKHLQLSLRATLDNDKALLAHLKDKIRATNDSIKSTNEIAKANVESAHGGFGFVVQLFILLFTIARIAFDNGDASQQNKPPKIKTPPLATYDKPVTYREITSNKGDINNEIVSLKKQKLSHKEIAERLNTTDATVSRALKIEVERMVKANEFNTIVEFKEHLDNWGMRFTDGMRRIAKALPKVKRA